MDLILTSIFSRHLPLVGWLFSPNIKLVKIKSASPLVHISCLRSPLANVYQMKGDVGVPSTFFFPLLDTTLVFFIFGLPEGYNSHEVMFY